LVEHETQTVWVLPSVPQCFSLCVQKLAVAFLDSSVDMLLEENAYLIDLLTEFLNLEN
jgi:hypothetical protein